MSRYKIYDQNGANFVTLTVVGWVDIFTRQVYRDIFLESLRYCQANKGLQIFAYVMMSNHVHLIVQAAEGYVLSDILRDCKKYTAQKILAAIESERESRREWLLYLFKYFASKNTNNRNLQFWEADNHPIALWSDTVFKQKLGYIHNNPVRAGIVAEPAMYLYSSASNYETGKGLIEVFTDWL